LPLNDFPTYDIFNVYTRACTISKVRAHVQDVLHIRIREVEGGHESPTAAIIGSESLKTGSKVRAILGQGAVKRVEGRKRHPVTDSLGLMLGIEVISAGVQDRDGAMLVLDRIARYFPFTELAFPLACTNRRFARYVEGAAETVGALLQIATIKPIDQRIAR
jgi:hypothetical protein